mgnify:CR=1 FL=1
MSDTAEDALFALYTCVWRHVIIRLCYGRGMSTPDLNLLVTLDVLLAECSVARAARRLRLSPSAMSRALARLRETTGDPLLVRAGRGLVPTTRALKLREQVGPLVQAAEAALRPVEKLDLERLVRTYTLRTSEGFVENFGPVLIARVAEEAPGPEKLPAGTDKHDGRGVLGDRGVCDMPRQVDVASQAARDPRGHHDGVAAEPAGAVDRAQEPTAHPRSASGRARRPRPLQRDH